ncbi:MAG: hypothetical protein V4722_03045 [Bacteroidota bacterium]
MYKVIGLLCICVVTQTKAQYYYNDILGNKQAKDNYLLLKQNNIKKITVNTTDPNGEPTEGFAILQEINARKNEMTTSTQSALSPTSILSTKYLLNGYPATTTDSTEAAVSITNYTYQTDNLSVINSTTHEPEQHIVKFYEQRQYVFSATQPKTMLRIKNGKDSLLVKFVTDEHGWIGEEQWTEKGKRTETYYYYYDTRGKLTDIVRYSNKARRLLPDYTFEYDATGHIAQMTSFVNGTNQYRIWRYTYDERGLKTKEVVFNKDKQAEGKVIYNYE